VGYRAREDHICDRDWGFSRILYFATHQNLGSLSEALKNRFYPPGYVQSLWIKWHQLRQLPSQGVQGYIDFFCNMHLLLHVPDPEEVLILKFVASLLIQFHQEV
jgi:hypothetical protein